MERVHAGRRWEGTVIRHEKTNDLRRKRRKKKKRKKKKKKKNTEFCREPYHARGVRVRASGRWRGRMTFWRCERDRPTVAGAFPPPDRRSFFFLFLALFYFCPYLFSFFLARESVSIMTRVTSVMSIFRSHAGSFRARKEGFS
jgi:hypothetical protein